jgi:signal transduction histidine kinase
MASVSLRLKPSDTWLGSASSARLRWISVALAFVSFAVTQGLHWLFFPLDDLAQLGRRMAGDALGAVVIGLLVCRLLKDMHERRQATLERLRLIADLNHHIRNSLQAIQFSAQALDHDAAVRQIDESVERINRALGEIIPMPENISPHSPEDGAS